MEPDIQELKRWLKVATQPYEPRYKAAKIDAQAAVTRMVPQIIARLEAAEAAMQWRPIEDAPKDDFGVLAFVPTYYRGRGAVIKAIWLDGEWYDNLAHTVTPTHYMPLPAPPEATR